jgi:hypothetical protein
VLPGGDLTLLRTVRLADGAGPATQEQLATALAQVMGGVPFTYCSTKVSRCFLRRSLWSSQLVVL